MRVGFLGQSGVSKANYKGLIIGVVVVVVIVAILFIPMIPVGETYNETEPFNRLATYQVNSATFTQELELLGRGVYHRSTVTITNTDSYGGTFTVTHSCYDVNGLFGTKTTDGYISAGGTQSFTAEFDTALLQDVRAEYSVSAPTVIDQRVVTKTRTVYKSPIDLLINR
jgi:hypothetical protein